VIAPALALGSSVTGGAADFLGGTTSRRVGMMQFLFCTQLFGVLFAGIVVALSGDPLPDLRTLATAAGAGLGLTVSLGAFFQAMVVGAISVVAPISATGVVVPIIVSLVEGEQPSSLQALGIVIAIVGVILAGQAAPEEPAAEGHSPAPKQSGLGLALLAAAGGGLFFWLMAPASHHGVPWALLTARTVPTIVLSLGVVIRRVSLRSVAHLPVLRIAVLAALLATSSIALYGQATRSGHLATISVLGAMYPAVTVILAYHVLGERLYGKQRIGILAVLAGVILMSLG
jgi:uncharacterized membrane protein